MYRIDKKNGMLGLGGFFMECWGLGFFLWNVGASGFFSGSIFLSFFHVQLSSTKSAKKTCQKLLVS